MTASAIFATIRAIRPVISYAIDVIEESGIVGNNEKLAAALNLIQELMSDSGIEQAWELIEPTVKRTIAILVSLRHFSGKFRKKDA